MYHRRVSAAYPMVETANDPTQTALAMHGVNSQCLYCLSRGCGYCYVSNLLQGALCVINFGAKRNELPSDAMILQSLNVDMNSNTNFLI